MPEPQASFWAEVWRGFRARFLKLLAGTLGISVVCAGLAVAGLPMEYLRWVAMLSGVSVGAWVVWLEHRLAHEGPRGPRKPNTH